MPTPGAHPAVESRAAMCAAVQAELGALLDDELEPALAAEVRRHLTKCAACAAELAQVTALRERVRRTGRGAPPAPDSLRERVRRQLSRHDPED